MRRDRRNFFHSFFVKVVKKAGSEMGTHLSGVERKHEEDGFTVILTDYITGNFKNNLNGKERLCICENGERRKEEKTTTDERHLRNFNFKKKLFVLTLK